MLGDLALTRDATRLVTATYATGDAKVIVRISYRAPKTSQTFTGMIGDMVQGRLEAFNPGAPMPRFGTVQGVAFLRWPMTDRDRKTGDAFDVTYRRLSADLGRAVDIMVVTNADDAAVQAILTGSICPVWQPLPIFGRAWCAPIWPLSGARPQALPWMPQHPSGISRHLWTRSQRRKTPSARSASVAPVF